tara:strand:+ start:7819 stop:9888 length:2070 start_codon:yes stop_codon:yes gene_type:complete
MHIVTVTTDNDMPECPQNEVAKPPFNSNASDDVIKLYVAANNSAACNIKTHNLLPFTSLKAALTYMVVPATSVHKHVSANEVWDFSDRKTHVACGNTAEFKIGARKDWHSMPPAVYTTRNAIDLDLTTSSSSVTTNGFYNQYNFLTNLPDMPSNNALASYPGTVAHMALSHFSKKNVTRSAKEKEIYSKMQQMLGINDPMLSSIGQLVAKTLYPNGDCKSNDRRVIMPHITWNSSVPMVYPDLESSNQTIEFKTQWANTKGNVVRKGANVNQTLAAAVSVWLMGKYAAGVAAAPLKSSLVCVSIPNVSTYVKTIKMVQHIWQIDADVTDRVYKQIIAHAVIFRQELNIMYCDEFCCFPICSRVGKMILTKNTPIYIHWGHLSDTVYKYSPAFWTSPGAVRVESVDPKRSANIELNRKGTVQRIDTHSEDDFKMSPTFKTESDVFIDVYNFTWFKSPFDAIVSTKTNPRGTSSSVDMLQPDFKVGDKVRAKYNKKVYEGVIDSAEFNMFSKRASDNVDVYVSVDNSLCNYKRATFDLLELVDVPDVPDVPIVPANVPTSFATKTEVIAPYDGKFYRGTIIRTQFAQNQNPQKHWIRVQFVEADNQISQCDYNRPQFDTIYPLDTSRTAKDFVQGTAVKVWWALDNYCYEYTQYSGIIKILETAKITVKLTDGDKSLIVYHTGDFNLLSNV